jgi:hypothetical protein
MPPTPRLRSRSQVSPVCLGATVNFVGTNLGREGNAPHVLPSSTFRGRTRRAGTLAIANSTDYAAINMLEEIGSVGQGGYAAYDGSFCS